MPQGFKGQSGVVDAWVPMMMAPVLMHPRRLEMPHAHWHEVIAKLRPGIDLEAAQARIRTLAGTLEESHSTPAGGAAKSAGLRLVPLRDSNLDPVISRTILIAMAAVGLVLLIACVNVANVFLARAACRERELATRLALGASRGRLATQLLTEAMLLSLVGGVLGLLFAWWGIEVLSAIRPSSSPIFRSKDIQTLNFAALGLDVNVLLFTLGVSVASGLLFGLLPSLRLSRANLSEILKQSGRGISASSRHLKIRGGLVVAQVGLSVVLLVGAGLLMRSLLRLQAVETGFQASGVVTLKVQLPGGYDQLSFNQRLLARAKALPGVVSAAVSNSTPLSSNAGGTLARTAGKTYVPGQEPFVTLHSISGDYFKTLSIPLIRGRNFTDEDRTGAGKVVVLNLQAARQFWPGEDAIGKRLWLAVGWGDDEYAEVVGVVGDVKYGKIEEQVQAAAYVPYLQPVEPASILLVRSQMEGPGVVAALREVVRSLDRNLPVYDIQTMEDRAGEAVSRARFSAVLLGAFGFLSLALSSIGIYGVMAYTVAARLSEIGIRSALGAGAFQLLFMILRQGLVLTALGLALGLPAALAAARILTGQLYEVGSADPLTLVLVSGLLALVSLAASYLPASVAARTQPGAILRAE
jgi:putative ABC transport system permease protein